MFVNRLEKIENKVIVLTGGSSGIGYELVRLLEPKNTIMVIARASSRLQTLAEEFPSVQTFATDLSEPENYRKVTEHILQRTKNIDILINNAAVQYTPSFLDDDFSYATIEREINLNFTAVCALSYLFLPALLHSNTPSTHKPAIVNINSGLALAPKSSSAIYCATKGAMNAFSQSLAYQLEHTNVQVMQAFLPLVDTSMTRGRDSKKLSAEHAAAAIIHGIEKGDRINNIGKVKLLRLLLVIAPAIAKKILKRS